MLVGAELGLIAPQLEQPLPPAEPERDGDPHLRSCGEVTGYYVAATDGDVCHVEDFLFDDETWAIRYLVVATPQLVAGQEGARLAGVVRADRLSTRTRCAGTTASRAPGRFATSL